jgi:16S rRNA (cytosine1402-N4)-methyltransferase
LIASVPDQSPSHVPVMLAEVLQWLAPKPGGIYFDGTLGGGGHTRALAGLVEPGGYVIAVDRDPKAIAAAERNLAGLPIKLAESDFADMPEVLDEVGIEAVDGMVLDVGLSSDQLADSERGFSFDADGALDLRFNPALGRSAADLVNRLDAERLANVIYQYGEERYSRRIARAIVEARTQRPINTARELAELVRRCVPRESRKNPIDPATRTFQALRIAVNDELGSLERALAAVPARLKPGGRIVVISFHSLEDRRVKEAFRQDSRYEILTRKPVRPAPEEIDVNPRARSAKLRAASRA